MTIEIDKSRLLNASGARLVKGLFIELAHIYDKNIAVYTLARDDKEVDGVVYPSLYRLYMECEDVTEAEFVRRYMYDMKQWEMLSSSHILRDDLAYWRKELALYKRGQAVAALEEDALAGGKSAMASAKFLIEKVYGTSTKGPGRPSKKESAKGEDDTTLFSSTSEELSRVLGNAE